MSNLKDIIQSRLPMRLAGEHVRVHLVAAAVAETSLDLTVKQVGLDYIAGVTDAGGQVLIPLSAILYVERLP